MKQVSVSLIISFLLSVSTIFAQTGNNTNTTLWRISGKHLTKPSYLFGTIHLPQKKFVEYTDSVYEAINKTDKLYTEVDLGENKWEIFQDKELMNFLMEKGEFMKSLMKMDKWKVFIAQVNRRYNENIDPTNIDELFSFVQKNVGETFIPDDPGMTTPDMMLAGYAKSIGKPTGALETAVSQFKMLYDLLDTRLADSTIGFDDDIIMAEKIGLFYTGMRLDSITAMMESLHPAFKKIMLDDRNKKMADSIIKHTLAETGFFAVGYAHLAGKESVIAHLRQQGYTVEPVHSQSKISLLIINDIISRSRYPVMKLAPGDLEDVKIDIKDEEVEKPPVAIPPPPPPASYPPKVKMKPAK